MKTEEPRDESEATRSATLAQFTGEADPGDARAWEQVDVGRYMPRRIRGSFRGRALG
jgi:hypothetical protein